MNGDNIIPVMKGIGLISDKLDFHIRISLSLSQEMGLFFAKIEEPIPLYATLNDDSAEISLYLGEELRKKFDPSFGKFTQTSKGKFDILNFKAEELMFEFQIFRDITKIPSVVPGGFYLKEGWVYADFRFHHSSLQKVSGIMRRITEAKNRIHISKLSPSPGLEDTLRGIISRISITNVSFSYTPEPGYLPKEVLDASPMAEAKLYSGGMETEYESVIYSSNISGDAITVDSQEGIHETMFSTPYMRKLIGEVRREKIPIASLVGQFTETEVLNHFFVPSFIADQLLETIFRITDETGQKGVKITAYEELTPENF